MLFTFIPTIFDTSNNFAIESLFRQYKNIETPKKIFPRKQLGSDPQFLTPFLSKKTYPVVVMFPEPISTVNSPSVSFPKE